MSDSLFSSGGVGAGTLLSSPALPRGGDRGPQTQLTHAAGEFESILLNQWLEGAEATFGSVPGGDGEEEGSSDQMRSFAVQILAKGITAAGGIGLARIVSGALASHSEASADSTSGIQQSPSR